jgi:lysophospholipase L1-like esterase/pimeloyl-ACP methyl ester carboxylesterase
MAEARQNYAAIEKRLQATRKGQAPARLRLACVGNSITWGHGLRHPGVEAYPAQLQRRLGYDYEVLNFGVSGRTVMNTEAAYMTTPAYQQALEANPDIVTIKLGTNDSRSPFKFKVADNFLADYNKLVQSFRELPARPRIILLLPVASYLTDTARQTDQVIAREIIPRIRRLAYEQKLEVLDLHALTLERQAWFPDGLHPNAEGEALIANRLAEYLSSKTEAGFDLFPKIGEPYQVSNFHGYDCATFQFKGREAKIVKPRRVAQGRPWVWRARFFGHEPQTDIALLERGFHIVYCDAAELFGNPQAVNLWNHFYDLLQQAGLSPKAVLEAMSRGGVYAYNWAAQNPARVAAVYADAPVLDLRSWPGGKGHGTGSMADWEAFKKAYGFTSEQETLSFRGNPLDRVAALVKGKYPMLHVVGDADEVVPVAENTALFEQKVKALGGDIRVIHKPGVGHHPHSLANPQPIVDFIMQAVYGKGKK